MTFSDNDGGGGMNWFGLYLISIVVVLTLDCFRSLDWRAAEIITNCIVFIGMNYILNDLNDEE